VLFKSGRQDSEKKFGIHLLKCAKPFISMHTAILIYFFLNKTLLNHTDYCSVLWNGL